MEPPSDLAHRIADFFWLDEPWPYREDRAREIQSYLTDLQEIAEDRLDRLTEAEIENTDLREQLASAKDEIDELRLDLLDARGAIPK